MLILKHIKALQSFIKSQKNDEKVVGFVPTMGALHEGHLQLIDQCNALADISVCSIFVNPTQFNDKKDLDNYPVTLSEDTELLIKRDCDVLFLPSVEEMYPNGFEDNTEYDFGRISNMLEGAHRPGHFNGMAQIVEKLLHAVDPDMLIMGQKDYQQQLIVSKLIEQMQISTKLHMAQTVREADGLAMSSRNRRLSPDMRQEALKLSKTLFEAADMVQKGHQNVEEFGQQQLESIKDVKVDYFAVVNASDLSAIDYSQPLPAKVSILAAIHLPGVRLIDNVIVSTT